MARLAVDKAGSSSPEISRRRWRSARSRRSDRVAQLAGRADIHIASAAPSVELLLSGVPLERVFQPAHKPTPSAVFPMPLNPWLRIPALHVRLIHFGNQ